VFFATDPVPDHSTISRFRSDLKASRLYRRCFSELERQIAEKGFELRSGKVIDARLVKAARGFLKCSVVGHYIFDAIGVRR